MLRASFQALKFPRSIVVLRGFKILRYKAMRNCPTAHRETIPPVPRLSITSPHVATNPPNTPVMDIPSDQQSGVGT
jgi:hypothetical protein